jgi:ferredoxin-NADP reductase
MAETREARLIATTFFHSGTALLRFAVGEDFVFTGGQYIIVNTGISTGDSKTVKRAYSILSADADRRTFEIAVYRVGEGGGSNFMRGLEPGATLLFTGPWGKFRPPDESSPRGDVATQVVVIATDTGITAALGLVSGQAYHPLTANTRLYWLVASDNYFISEKFVRERVVGHCAHFERIQVPVEQTARGVWLAQNKDELLRTALCNKPKAAYLAGDGSLLAVFRDQINAEPGLIPEIRVESFFNHQALKVIAHNASQ